MVGRRWAGNGGAESREIITRLEADGMTVRANYLNTRLLSRGTISHSLQFPVVPAPKSPAIWRTIRCWTAPRRCLPTWLLQSFPVLCWKRSSARCVDAFTRPNPYPDVSYSSRTIFPLMAARSYPSTPPTGALRILVRSHILFLQPRISRTTTAP